MDCDVTDVMYVRISDGNSINYDSNFENTIKIDSTRTSCNLPSIMRHVAFLASLLQ